MASALASVTPPPAFSELVYQAVRPSLVLIETKGPAKAGKPDEGGLGSGVVVTLDGDILTSLHVVADATEIELTFADGTSRPREIVGRAARERHRGRPRRRAAGRTSCPATLGNPGAVQQGSEAYAMGSPFGL